MGLPSGNKETYWVSGIVLFLLLLEAARGSVPPRVIPTPAEICDLPVEDIQQFASHTAIVIHSTVPNVLTRVNDICQTIENGVHFRFHLFSQALSLYLAVLWKHVFIEEFDYYAWQGGLFLLNEPVEKGLLPADGFNLIVDRIWGHCKERDTELQRDDMRRKWLAAIETFEKLFQNSKEHCVTRAYTVKLLEHSTIPDKVARGELATTLQELFYPTVQFGKRFSEDLIKKVPFYYVKLIFSLLLQEITSRDLELFSPVVAKVKAYIPMGVWILSYLRTPFPRMEARISYRFSDDSLRFLAYLRSSFQAFINEDGALINDVLSTFFLYCSGIEPRQLERQLDMRVKILAKMAAVENLETPTDLLGATLAVRQTSITSEDILREWRRLLVDYRRTLQDLQEVMFAESEYGAQAIRTLYQQLQMPARNSNISNGILRGLVALTPDQVSSTSSSKTNATVATLLWGEILYAIEKGRINGPLGTMVTSLQYGTPFSG